ncbi:MAG: hypothetical protein K0S81_2168, partial [Rhodospirillales bacterium]|nr:hypothetical protein [Rhodospirillales bacterium]
ASEDELPNLDLPQTPEEAVQTPEPPVPLPAEPPPAPTQTAQEEGIEPPAERALERSLVQQGGLLLPPWTFEIQPGFNYSYSGSNTLRITEVGGESVVVQTDANRDTLETSLGFRVGLPWAMQVDVLIPYIFDDEDIVSGGTVIRTGDAGLGDIQLSLSKQLLTQQERLPSLLATVAWKTASGDSGGDLGLGTGAHSIQLAGTAVIARDPMVYVGTVSITESFEGEQGGRDYDPGDSLGLRVAAILAVSPDTSFTFGLDTDFVEDAEVEGERVAGSDAVIAVFELGVGLILSRSALLTATAGIGVTEEAPDFQFGMAVPIRF